MLTSKRQDPIKAYFFYSSKVRKPKNPREKIYVATDMSVRSEAYRSGVYNVPSHLPHFWNATFHCHFHLIVT